jgi:molybdopterin-guanine dinucleotide biosynthesis protein A
VTALLEAAQQAELLEMTDVQAGRGRIEADIEHHPGPVDPVGQGIRIGQLMNQTPPAEVFEEGWHGAQPATPRRTPGWDYRPGRTAIMGDMPAAGLLLTGGASRRMGQDKAALPATDTGESLSGRTARLLAAATAPAIEIGPGWTDLPAIVELQRGGGPLVAIAAGRRELSARGWDGPAVVVATDLPHLTIELLSWLVEHPSRTSVVPVALGVPQPLCARYTARDLDRAVVLAAMGRRSMRDLIDGSDTLLVAPEQWQPAAGSPDALDDVDTPEDLARLRPPG